MADKKEETKEITTDERLSELEQTEAIRKSDIEEKDKVQETNLAKLKTYAIIATAVFTFLAIVVSLFLFYYRIV